MDHGEATQMMAAERYLLDELTPEEKDAFEQHLFDCRDCALDVRAGAAFVSEARAQLAETEFLPVASTDDQALPVAKKRWSFLWHPSFAVPAFAAMLVVIAYQNVSTIPSLRKAAMEPKLLPSNTIHVGTRGAAHTAVRANRTAGVALAMELPPSPAYSSFSFTLQDPSGKQVWSHNFTSANTDTGDDRVVSLVIPGAWLMQGSYSLSIFGITPTNGRVEIDRRVLDVQFDN